MSCKSVLKKCQVKVFYKKCQVRVTIISRFLLVPTRVPRFVPLLFWFRGMPSCSCGFLFHHHLVVSSGSGWGFGAWLPTLMGFCSNIICWFLLIPGRVPDLSLYSYGLLFHHLLVSSGSRWGFGLVSLLFWQSVPSSFAGFWFQVGLRTCLSTLLAICSIIICWFLLVPDRVPDSG